MYNGNRKEVKSLQIKACTETLAQTPRFLLLDSRGYQFLGEGPPTSCSLRAENHKALHCRLKFTKSPPYFCFILLSCGFYPSKMRGNFRTQQKTSNICHSPGWGGWK
ncbi:uncharacterized protein LOC110193947 isoform X2 [Phascolarctos cinereus]